MRIQQRTRNYKKNQIQQKNTVSEMKNTLKGINEIAEEQIRRWKTDWWESLM